MLYFAAGTVVGHLLTRPDVRGLVERYRWWRLENRKVKRYLERLKEERRREEEEFCKRHYTREEQKL
ncbi:MAG TPA: hypothetical protein EYP78_07050 [Candidatus Omnitrophica bacterium]|nr:hypothetical protein [Candidatus Omnitrophota bacterium]